MDKSSKTVSESTSLMEGLIRPEDYARFKETKGRTTEVLTAIKRSKPKKSGRPKQGNKKKLSRREIAKLGIYAIPDDAVQYSACVPLHRLWRGYVGRYLGKDMLPDVNDAQYGQFVSDFLKVDFHGAKISVVRSKNPSLVGAKGIVILDTKGTFKIVSKDDRIRTIPKNDSVFLFHWNDIELTVFGKHLNTRPAERSVKKYKVFCECDLD